ncbi:MAG: ribosomal protein L13e [Promethearchaeota archaeon]
MSFDIIAEPVVKSPRDARPRRGRGFSVTETKEAGLTMKEARQMGLIIDNRRRTAHSENVEILKQYVKEFEKLADEIISVQEKPSAKPKVSSEKAIAELSSIRAVKKEEAESLFAAGIKSLSDLAYCDIEKTAKKTGIDEERVTLMVKAALKKV